MTDTQPGRDVTRPGSSPPPDEGADEGPSTYRPRMGVGMGTVVKVVLLGAVNTLVLVGIPAMISNRAWFGLASAVTATVIIDVVFLSKKRIALKYLVPGLIFLLTFQVYPVLYNAYIAFTNYGTGNILTKEQAISEIERQSLFTPEDATRYAATPMADNGEVALLLTAPDERVFLGTAEGLVDLAGPDAPEVTAVDDRIEAVGDFARIPLREAQDRQRELESLRIPLDDGEIRLTTFTAAVRRDAARTYDPDRDVMVDARDGLTYAAVGGNFVADDGTRLTPGWRVVVGTANFERVLTSPAIRGPFLRVFVWTYAFALLSVTLQFALGLALAISLNKAGMRGQRFYRSIMVIPFALPSFLTALVWAGMFNREFGVINSMIGAAVPWLQDPTLAKIAILIVATWQGFPYMFLVTTGALQSIPREVLEAASVDGASPFGAFRRVTFPLLMVSVAPLLIASFAFNFNNFNIIYLLTRGNPPIAGAQTPAGHTDILISYTYRLAFEGGRGQDFGFAAAISVFIFVMVAAISAYSFRYTRQLEEIN